MASTSRTTVRVNEIIDRKSLVLCLHTEHIINSTVRINFQKALIYNFVAMSLYIGQGKVFKISL